MGKCGEDGIDFFINGDKYSVNPEKEDFDPDTRLVDYIRDKACLKGTKIMCREGGCGACVVTIKSQDPITGREITKAVNSCLTPVLSCNGWDISTVEKLGNKKNGYHKIQQRLTKFNGTQCGFCTPGMVMNMYSLMKSKENVKVQDVHDSFDGNICRCTGYRPILDAFKSLAIDAPENLKSQCEDIENCAGCPHTNQINGCCKADISQTFKCNYTMKFNLSSGQEWIQAMDLESAFLNMERFARDGKKYRVVAGNTGTGVFKYDGPYDAYLDINNIKDLKNSSLDTAGVVIGGGISLTAAIKLLLEASELPGYEYTAHMSRHLERVANTPVRNNATIAGNLMLKHKHNEFPSDVFLLLETVGAKINIGSSAFPLKLYTMIEFIKMDMDGKLIVSLYLPQRKGDYRFRSFKISKRHQNAHAYINAGFLFKIDPAQNFLVLEKPRIVFGGIHPQFIHATVTELYLMGKNLGDENVLRGALDILDKEINPEIRPPEASPEYRKILTKSLLYKTILNIIGSQTKDNLRSGALDIKREIGKGVQKYDIEKDDWVLYKNLGKIEACVQTSGEAVFINDIPPQPDELYGAFVLSTVANADIKSIDASDALKIPGVVAFISEKDIPGKNNFMSFALFLAAPMEEPIFAKTNVSYAGQSLGMIVAKSNAIASAATKKVKVLYENKKKPLLDILESLKKAEEDGVLEQFTAYKSITPALQEQPKHVVKGQFQMGGQYHFHMETQVCICIPKEDGMDVYSSTQWMDQTQIVIADALGVPTNNINVEVRRLGGGFGAKITKSTHVAAACAVAANALNKPVRVVLDLETNMKMIGKRLPYVFRYEVGFDDEGKIGNLKADGFCDPGCTTNEQDSVLFPLYIQNTYEAVGWEVKPGYLLTDTAPNTFCRGPGSVQGAALIEYIMEHISHELKKDSLEVRMTNFFKTGDPIFPSGEPLEENLCVRIIDEIKVSADYETRKARVKTFNQEHRWKKRGMSLVPIKYKVDFFGGKFSVSVVIYHHDCHVAVSHSGIEMGQGLNTKVAQTVAHTLKIPFDKIKIKPTNTFNGPNALFTGGSIGSELCANAAKNACQILLDRMEPIKAKLEDKSWENVVKETYNANIDLAASYMHGPNDKIKEYFVYLVSITEVEIDVLTGEFKVVRVDLTEDTGKSLNPAIDVGQIEGGFIMGQGLWTTEKLVYDQKTGELLTSNTWDYKPPETKDVPENFRITILSNNINQHGVLGSKATGEPSLVSSVSVFLAIKNAIDSARKDSGNNDWYAMDGNGDIKVMALRCSDGNQRNFCLKKIDISDVPFDDILSILPALLLQETDGPVTPEDIVRYALTSSSDFVYS